MKRMPHTPSYRYHKASGQGFVELDGHRIYLGKWGLPETEQRYHRTVAEWIAKGRRLPVAPEEITVAEMIVQYWEHCKTFYVRTDGRPSQHQDMIRFALATLRQFYVDVNAATFGPKALRVLQDHWANKVLARNTVNRNVGVVRRAFKWAASHEIIPVMVAHGLDTVEGLRAGRSAAREAKHICPVPDEHVDAIRDFVAPPVWALIQLQRLTGARSGELLELRPCDIDRTGRVWTAKIENHKSRWAGRDRVIPFGPQVQSVLRPFLLRPADAFLFDPHDAVVWQASRFTTHRRPNQKSEPRKTNYGFSVGERLKNHNSFLWQPQDRVSRSAVDLSTFTSPRTERASASVSIPTCCTRSRNDNVSSIRHVRGIVPISRALRAILDGYVRPVAPNHWFFPSAQGRGMRPKSAQDNTRRSCQRPWSRAWNSAASFRAAVPGLNFGR